MGKVYRILITVFLATLASWLLHYSWLERKVEKRVYEFTQAEAEQLGGFSEAQYAYGLKAWYENDAKEASGYFRKAADEDPLYIDAWLKLAETEASMGHLDKAREILKFADDLSDKVIKWKWPEALLANELAMDDIFVHNVNYLVSKNRETQNAFQLLDVYAEGSVAATVDLIDDANLVSYLNWLMRWGRAEDAIYVWPKINPSERKDGDLILKYVHFLVSKKHIQEARSVWQAHTGIEGMTNPGFEEEITGRGFGWRYGTDKEKRRWDVKRALTPGYTGSYALRVSFRGLENLSFYHVYQIAPVEPVKSYKLTYRWKSDEITTDQGPFIEIYGYDQKGLHQKGPMITGARPWTKETIEFTAPEGCHAVVIRLRRVPSHRFDCKIDGTVWLDDFNLEKQG